MRVTEVTITEDGSRAFIVLRPSWLARVLFRAPIRTVELKRVTLYPSSWGWDVATTGRSLCDHEHRSLIISALESRPVGADAVIPFAKWIARR